MRNKEEENTKMYDELKRKRRDLEDQDDNIKRLKNKITRI